MSQVARQVCGGCGAIVPLEAGLVFRCPNADTDAGEHVLRRVVPLPTDLGDPGELNPFVRFRRRLLAWHRAHQAGWSDARFVALVEQLDAAVAAVDGTGFRFTPLGRFPALDAATGVATWVKDDTRNVSGSHKARHLFGVLLELEVAHALGLGPERQTPLAIASCGNAALAGAVVARAAERPIRVFIPTDANPKVVARLRSLGAEVVVCERRTGEVGDPCYLRFREAVDRGALPFCCQGPDNGLCIQGGETLAWELLAGLDARQVALDALYVQVGGGALGSAMVSAWTDAVQAGLVSRLPRFRMVQTEAVAPLEHAWRRITAEPLGLRRARAHRAQVMSPWSEPGHSAAHGILDDETYDWLALVEGMLASGGAPVVVDEVTVLAAAELGPRATGISVDPTGTSGLAGLLAARPLGGEVGVLFTGGLR